MRMFWEGFRFFWSSAFIAVSSPLRFYTGWLTACALAALFVSLLGRGAADLWGRL